MGNCIFIAADTPLPEVTPSQDYPLHTHNYQKQGIFTQRYTPLML